jgi:hypothetical protein
MSSSSVPRARQQLDRVRAMLGVMTRGPACLTCGGPTAQPQRRPLLCPLCGGKQVRAENLVRALREVLRPDDGARGSFGAFMTAKPRTPRPPGSVETIDGIGDGARARRSRDGGG